MIEYPKAIYKGNPDEFETKVVNDSDEEFAAKSDGFVEFAYLGEPVEPTTEPKTKSKKAGVDDGNNELRDTANSDSELATSN